MGNNFLVVAIVAAALICGLMIVLYSFLKSKKFIYAIPAVAGAVFLYIGFALLGASSWRVISAAALAVGAAGVLISIILFLCGIKRRK